jgi:hypothetical protein
MTGESLAHSDHRSITAPPPTAGWTWLDAAFAAIAVAPPPSMALKSWHCAMASRCSPCDGPLTVLLGGMRGAMAPKLANVHSWPRRGLVASTTSEMRNGPWRAGRGAEKLR